MHVRPLALALLLAATTAGCQDYDQRARALGGKARTEAISTCPRDGGAAEDVFAIDACVGRACEASCVQAGAPSFQRVCVDICAARGGCDRDEDCGPGLRCVAIAPVLRRCAVGPIDAGK